MIARLVESREVAPEIRHFVFEVPELEHFAFTPGQFVSFNEVVTGKKVTRAYSLASAPRGNRFELCLNRVQDGILSPYLFALQPGATLPFSGPLGYFVPRDPFRASVFIATGTGIAPFRGFLQDPRVAQAPVTLLFGSRFEAGLAYRQEFERYEAEHPAFRFRPTLTRPEAGWTGRTGRVQQHLDEALAGRSEVDVYICGMKAMVDDVRAILKARGFDRKQIIYEKYD